MPRTASSSSSCSTAGLLLDHDRDDDVPERLDVLGRAAVARKRVAPHPDAEERIEHGGRHASLLAVRRAHEDGGHRAAHRAASRHPPAGSCRRGAAPRHRARARVPLRRSPSPLRRRGLDEAACQQAPEALDRLGDAFAQRHGREIPEQRDEGRRCLPARGPRAPTTSSKPTVSTEAGTAAWMASTTSAISTGRPGGSSTALPSSSAREAAMNWRATSRACCSSARPPYGIWNDVPLAAASIALVAADVTP